MELGPVFHWAPTRLHRTISREGLRVYTYGEPTENPVTGRAVRVGFPYLCFGTSPRTAWNLLPEAEREYDDDDPKAEGWDLWEVELARGDEIQVRDDWTPKIREVRTRNSITADRIWYVGHRPFPVADELPVDDDERSFDALEELLSVVANSEAGGPMLEAVRDAWKTYVEACKSGKEVFRPGALEELATLVERAVELDAVEGGRG